MVQIKHGIHICKEEPSIVIPEKFKDLLDDKIFYWKTEGIFVRQADIFRLDQTYYYSENHALFTMGFDPNTEVFAIAIKHPTDSFKVEIGKKVVVGRIQRYLGERKKLYDRDPKFIFCDTTCKKCKTWSALPKSESGICSSIHSKHSKKSMEYFQTCEEFT